MRMVVSPALVPLALVLLAGCVQQGYLPPAPIQLQPYGPAIPYRTVPYDRAPLAEPAPTASPIPLDTPTAPPTGDNGAIPLQDMPAPISTAPTAETPAAAPTAAKPQEAAPAPAVQRNPTTGPGSNVPLEGFRPMHSQTRPTP